eukprot:910950-Pleurochrysis_carterae.AAC.8
MLPAKISEITEDYETYDLRPSALTSAHWCRVPHVRTVTSTAPPPPSPCTRTSTQLAKETQRRRLSRPMLPLLARCRRVVAFGKAVDRNDTTFSNLLRINPAATGKHVVNLICHPDGYAARQQSTLPCPVQLTKISEPTMQMDATPRSEDAKLVNGSSVRFGRTRWTLPSTYAETRKRVDEATSLPGAVYHDQARLIILRLIPSLPSMFGRNQV